MLETDFFLYVCIYTIYRINLFYIPYSNFPSLSHVWTLDIMSRDS